MATQWINNERAAERLKLPVSVDVDEILDIDAVVEDYLIDLLTIEQFSQLKTWLDDNPAGEPSGEGVENPFAAGLFEHVEKFLIDAAYADYVFGGDLKNTETGLVSKDRDDSSAMSDVRRAEIYRRKRAKADRSAGRIAEFIAGYNRPDASCNEPVQTISVRVSKAQGRYSSPFDSF